MQPHQRDITNLLAAAVQACHDMVVPFSCLVFYVTLLSLRFLDSFFYSFLYAFVDFFWLLRLTSFMIRFLLTLLNHCSDK